MLSKEYKLVPSFALKFQCNKKALKIIPLCYADSKNGNYGEYEEKYIWHNTEKEKGENNTYMMIAIMQLCV